MRLWFLDGADTSSSSRSINSRYAAKFSAVVDYTMLAMDEGHDPVSEGPEAGVRKRGG